MYYIKAARLIMIISKVMPETQRLVTSIEENEGKSTVASNIALALAQSGKRVSLIDFDLRRPAVYKIFDLQSQKTGGLWKDVCRLDGAQSLNLILNGKPIKDTIGFLKMERVGNLIAEERQCADYIIIDTPPVNVAADTELLLSYTDAALLVVRQDRSHISEINNFSDLLSKSNVEYLGYVLNDFKNQNPMNRKQYDYGYGKHYDKYRYGEYSR